MDKRTAEPSTSCRTSPSTSRRNSTASSPTSSTTPAAPRSSARSRSGSVSVWHTAATSPRRRPTGARCVRSSSAGTRGCATWRLQPGHRQARRLRSRGGVRPRRRLPLSGPRTIHADRAAKLLRTREIDFRLRRSPRPAGQSHPADHRRVRIGQIVAGAGGCAADTGRAARRRMALRSAPHAWHASPAEALRSGGASDRPHRPGGRYQARAARQPAGTGRRWRGCAGTGRWCCSSTSSKSC